MREGLRVQYLDSWGLERVFGGEEELAMVLPAIIRTVWRATLIDEKEK
jgi:hypothetical protein